MFAGGDLSTGTNNTFLGYDSGGDITTGTKNTIIGSFNGNQGGLDIRTSSNNIVLSDGDGNPLMNINSSYRTLGAPKFREYYFSGYTNISSTFSHDVTFASDASTGTLAHVTASISHHPSYDAILDAIVSRRNTNQSTYEQFRRDTGNGGNWAISSPNSTTLRVTHNGGSYSGFGPYWVRVLLREAG
jgi:hypothetical protein